MSGGERRRLALARLALTGANLLLLDEPTNNLDVLTQESLQAALQAFPETILLVTHDRYLAQALATQVWTISPEEKAMEVFRGSYVEYVEARNARRTARSRRQPERDSPTARPAGRPSREVETIERQVEKAEAELQALGREIDAVGADLEAVTRLGLDYAQREKDLEALLEAWSVAAGQEDSA